MKKIYAFLDHTHNYIYVLYTNRIILSNFYLLHKNIIYFNIYIYIYVYTFLTFLYYLNNLNIFININNDLNKNVINTPNLQKTKLREKKYTKNFIE
ncbi:hypothetical protein PFNF54_02363 [Plasmodium falciparum NF54]|uniref:Uncharacterized protein n=1 Tax=Plasmodium falciparum (isolate NF54) TaxID=5843 RepID=W7K731_PLAFO|nr:hypothetical protein PFNF54_02363 [Plasmodium falciparum NF54]